MVNKKNVADILMYIGYILLVSMVILMTFYWPDKLPNGELDYSISGAYTFSWIIALIAIFIGFILKLWGNISKWLKENWKYSILFMTFVFIVLFINLLKKVSEVDLGPRIRFIILIILSALFMFLMSRFIEEDFIKSKD